MDADSYTIRGDSGTVTTYGYTDPNGGCVTYTQPDRYPVAPAVAPPADHDSDADRHADFWRGWLHPLRLPWRAGRGSGGAATWQRALSAGRNLLRAIRGTCGWHG